MKFKLSWASRFYEEQEIEIDTLGELKNLSETLQWKNFPEERDLIINFDNLTIEVYDDYGE